MLYSWNIRDLYECKKKLLEIFKNSKNNEDNEYIAIILQTLNEIISDLEDKSEIESVDYDERLAMMEQELQTFGTYYDIVDDFTLKIAAFDEQLSRIESIFKPFVADKESYGKYTGARLSNDRAFYLTKQFYQSFDPYWYPTFLKAYKKRGYSVNFLNKINDYNQADSFYIDKLNRYFIEMVKTDDVAKLFTLIHEYGHVLSYIFNPKRYSLCKDDMYDEVPAVFPEMLSIYTNAGHFDETQIAFEKHSSLITVYNMANSLVMHLPYVDIWKENNRSANDGFMAGIKKEFDEESEDIEESLDTYINSEGNYILAYMVAIELLHLYRRSQKKALDIYHGLVQLPYTENTHDYITSHLVLGSNLEEETSIMLDDFEKKLLKVGAFHV